MRQTEGKCTLIAVGDIMLGDHPSCIGFGVGSQIRRKGNLYPFLKIASYLNEADIVFGNLEAVLSDNGLDKESLKSCQLRASPEAVNGLKFAGFNVLSLANNHILEHGENALSDTLNILSANNIVPLGINIEKHEASDSRLVTVNGINIAFLGYCLVPDITAYAITNSADDILFDVKKAKSKANIVIVSLHWGNEYVERPSPWQVNLGHQIIDAGADLILGHHPHVLQGIEYYSGGLIVYSLGNFVFDMWQEEMRKTMIFRANLSQHGISEIETIPVFINKDYQPYICDNKHGYLPEIGEWLSKLEGANESNLQIMTNEYEDDVNKARNKCRREVKVHFLQNLWRRSPRYTIQMIIDFAQKISNGVS